MLLPQNINTTFCPANLPLSGPHKAAVLAAQAGSTAIF
jgi:hypothetical protein